MLKTILATIGLGGPEHDAQVLARDARNLIDMVHGQHGAESLGAIARVVRSRIDEVHKQGLNDPQFYGRGVTQLTELNRSARGRRDNIAWSGTTLAIIYIKSEMLGELGLAARNAIDGFIGNWQHVAGAADGPGGEDAAQI